VSFARKLLFDYARLLADALHFVDERKSQLKSSRSEWRAQGLEGGESENRQGGGMRLIE